MGLLGRYQHFRKHPYMYNIYICKYMPRPSVWVSDFAAPVFFGGWVLGLKISEPWRIQVYLYINTPLKINMAHNHGGLVQIIFLSKWVVPC